MKETADSGELLKLRRKQAGLTQAELADLAGLSIRLMNAIEPGKRRASKKESGQKPISALSERKLKHALLISSLSDVPAVSFERRRALAGNETCRRLAEDALGGRISELLEEAGKKDLIHVIVLEFEELVSLLKLRLGLCPRKKMILLRELLLAAFRSDQQLELDRIAAVVELIGRGRKKDKDGVSLPAKDSDRARHYGAELQRLETALREKPTDVRLLQFFQKKRMLASPSGQSFLFHPSIDLDQKVGIPRAPFFAQYWKAVKSAIGDFERGDIGPAEVTISPKLASGIFKNKCRTFVISQAVRSPAGESIESIWCRTGILGDDGQIDYWPQKQLRLVYGEFQMGVQFPDSDIRYLRFHGITGSGLNFESTTFLCTRDGLLKEVADPVRNWMKVERDFRVKSLKIAGKGKIGPLM